MFVREGNCLLNREQFSISLRKQKKSQILERKRATNTEGREIWALFDSELNGELRASVLETVLARLKS
jgi:hypothetical protein